MSRSADNAMTRACSQRVLTNKRVAVLVRWWRLWFRRFGCSFVEDAFDVFPWEPFQVALGFGEIRGQAQALGVDSSESAMQDETAPSAAVDSDNSESIDHGAAVGRRVPAHTGVRVSHGTSHSAH